MPRLRHKQRHKFKHGWRSHHEVSPIRKSEPPGPRFSFGARASTVVVTYTRQKFRTLLIRNAQQPTERSYTCLMRIRELEKFRKRRPAGSYFEDLPWEVQQRARRWLWKFTQRWKRNLPDWRFAILVARARWLSLNPPTSQWGRTMRAKLGGYAVQRKYTQEGRHPTAAATEARKWQRIAAKRTKTEQQRRKRLGLPDPPRIVHLPL